MPNNAGILIVPIVLTILVPEDIDNKVIIETDAQIEMKMPCNKRKNEKLYNSDDNPQSKEKMAKAISEMLMIFILSYRLANQAVIGIKTHVPTM